MSDRKLQIGVAGAGHFGRFHTLKVAASARAALVGVYDANFALAAQVAAEAGSVARDFSTLLAAAEAIIVATPAGAHHALVKQALLADKHVLVEKPIAATLAEADELATLAQARGLVLQVGHLERFSAAFAALSQRVSRPLYIEAVRIAPFKERGTDVSVILDLMIHDLDLVLALVNSPIERVDAVGAVVSSAHEDISNARIHFENGAVASITASRVSQRTERRMRVFTQDAYLTVDFSARTLTLVRRGAGIPVPGLEGFAAEQHAWDDHNSLAAEHAAFVAAVLDGAPVVVGAPVGRRALAAALMVAEATAAARAKAMASGLIQ